MAILGAIVVIFRKTILINLIELEEMGYLLQQETMVGCVEARQGLNLDPCRRFFRRLILRKSLRLEICSNMHNL